MQRILRKKFSNIYKGNIFLAIFVHVKRRFFVIYFVLLGVLPDFYILSCILMDAPWPWRLLACVPTAMVGVCLLLIGFGVRYTVAVRTTSYLTFLLQLPKTLFAVIHPAVRGALAPDKALLAALIPALAVSATFFILFFIVSRHLKVRTQIICFKDLPSAFDGLRICQLSDFHLGSFARNHRYIRRIVAKANALVPDIIFFTGDLVNFESENAVPYLEDLAALKAPMGIFAIRGNHDYMHHGPFKGADREKDMARLDRLEDGLGWRVLVDDNFILTREDGQLAIIGVENTAANPIFKGEGGDLEKALEGLPEGIFKILLSHDPSHWRSGIVPRGDIQLTLSGHTHGLKYKLAGPRPSHWKLPESSGVYREGTQVLHVSPGLGSSFSFRLGGFPCVDLIILKSTL